MKLNAKGRYRKTGQGRSRCFGYLLTLALQAGGGSAVKFSVDFVICTHRIVAIVISSSLLCPGHHDGIFFNGF